MSAQKTKHLPGARKPARGTAAPSNATWLHSALVRTAGWLILLVSVCFFTATYDSAQVKLTLLQCGSVLLAVLWAALKITQRQNPFTRQKWVLLAPLLVYMGWQTLAFLGFAYKMEAAEEFVRLWMYAGISALIACEFTAKDVQTLTKFIVATAWICFSYGALQILNIWLPGADLLPWHGFFGPRVFSTHANPNFFGAFIVFSSAIIGAHWLRTRRTSLLILLALGLADLVFTESKGAWLAYAGGGVFFALTYTRAWVKLPKHRLKINLAAGLCLLLAAGVAGLYSAKRFQSVSFRTYTWAATWDMIKDSPLLGTGPGSFKLVYPKYRRPQIFYIENAHNTETAHAENEYLEQAATGGFTGLVLFLGWMGMMFALAFKTLRAAPPGDLRRYDILGYSAALAGLLLHAFVDISVHFASSGLLLAVFVGALWALRLDNAPAFPADEKPAFPRLLWLARAAVGAGVLVLVIYLCRNFLRVLHNLAVTSLGEGILFALAALTFFGCVCAAAYLYGKISYKTSRVAVCAVLLASLPLYVFFFRVFMANHYYSIGVALVQLGQPQAALPAFTDAINHHPFLSEYRQFRANVLAGTLNPEKRFAPALGDTDRPRTDFERALDDLHFVRAHNPYHALLQQNFGQLYFAQATQLLAQAQAQPQQAFFYQQQAQENLAQAKAHFEQSLTLDPVNINTYLMLINLALLRHDLDQAQAWVDAYYEGAPGVEEEFVARNRQHPQMQAVQAHIARLRHTQP